MKMKCTSYSRYSIRLSMVNGVCVSMVSVVVVVVAKTRLIVVAQCNTCIWL